MDVRVDANVYPPVTDTGWITDEVRAFVAASAEHVHVAQPAEVAEVIGWLCTDAARLITGSISPPQMTAPDRRDRDVHDRPIPWFCGRVSRRPQAQRPGPQHVSFTR